MIRRFAIVLVFVVCALPLSAEKWLTKNGGDYLGNAKSDPRFFVTCQGGVIAVVKGTMRNAEDKCGGSSIVGPITGATKSFDESSGELIINDSHGNEVAFHLNSEEVKAVREIGLGRTLRIEGTAAHRTIRRN
jgi:hypothetical protein